MGEKNIELAARLTSGDSAPFFVEHENELYPLQRDEAALPEEVLLGEREPTEAETLTALKRQGYEV